MCHFDRRLERKELGDVELPNWAEHSGYSSVEYKSPGGVPEGDVREFLGLLCAELILEKRFVLLGRARHSSKQPSAA